MESKLSRWCDGLLEAGWLAVIVATPLFFDTFSARVFEPDKLTLLRSVAVIMSVTWLVKFIDQRGWQSWARLRARGQDAVWRIPFVLPTALLVVSYLISTLFSVTPQVSWAGSYQRLQGTYTTLSYIVVFALMAVTIRTHPQVRRVVTAVIITSIPVALYAMLQRRGLDPLPWGGNVQRRVAGHMGNAIFIAAYLIMAVPLTAARIIDAFTNILEEAELATADIIRSAIYIFALAIQIIAIYWSGSRGPWLGLGMGMFAFVLIVLVGLRNAAADRRRFQLRDALRGAALVFGGVVVLFLLLNLLFEALTTAGRLAALNGPMGSFVAFALAVVVIVLAILVLAVARRGWRWLWFAWLMVTLLVGGWLVAFNLADEPGPELAQRPLIGPVVQTLEDWRELPAIGRLGRVLESESGTGRVRVLIWQGVLDLIQPHAPLNYPDGSRDAFNFLRPLIGYGPESMYVAYNAFYPPELATVEARNASPDRSHNETFDALVITGLFGFLVWQALYLSVFYYSFSWLGVVRGSRDAWLLIGLWIGGAVLGGVFITLWLGPPFLGVAVPFGSIVGLILYLIYYALFAHGGDESSPFQADRLLLTGLVAAVMAHYVEIHFGIAIAATRIHFFVYLALLLLVGYVLPRLGQVEQASAVVEEVTTAATRKRRRGRARAVASEPANRGWLSPALSAAFVLALVIGVLCFNFITFSLPEGEVISSIADVPTAGEIFHQSFFVNTSSGFAASPFVYLMITMTWALGTLLSLSEMAKDGVFRQGGNAGILSPQRGRTAAILFAAWTAAALLLRFLPANAPVDTTSLLGGSLLLIWAAFTLYAAVMLFVNSPRGRLVGGVVAGIGLALSFALFGAAVPGYALAFLAFSCVLLYLLWDSTWQNLLLPGLFLAIASLVTGLLYGLLQAGQVRSSIIAPAGVTEETAEVVRRVLEAEQSAGFLTLFYIFVFGLLFAASVIIAWPRLSRARQAGEMPAFIALLILIPLGFVIVYNTNMRIIHADIVYKRGDPWEQQAVRSGDPQGWDNAIAIYERAIELAPREDFYYLFLGRAYLEKASLLGDDAAAREQLLNTANERLLEAQQINPLNTDHTANLARLNTRWADATAADEREMHVKAAKAYYEAALQLSPQNAIIRNERARLAYVFDRDCAASINLYDESAAIDPYYATTHFERAEIQIACAGSSEGEEKTTYYQQAVASIQKGLEMEDSDPRRWTQLAQVYEQLEQNEDALDAYEQARLRQNNRFPAWRTVLAMAALAQKMGDVDQAISYAQDALAGAPEEQKPQVQAYLAELTGEPLPAAPAADTPQVSPESFLPLTGDRPLAAMDPVQRNNTYTSYPATIIDQSKVYEAAIVTAKGTMRFRLYAREAPLTVNNFVFLATQGFYDGVTFHRVLENFMAQGGDPTGTGTGGPGYTFVNETDSGLQFDRPGLLAMANAGADTNGSQFFITFGPQPSLNGSYTIFGELIDGEEVLPAITRRDPTAANQPPGDVIERIDIFVADAP
ncbi:MAG: hypothetical protein Fur0021_12680 [Candidatus Promineifilaceae bacterium]